jgi:hypothetical protein
VLKATPNQNFEVKKSDNHKGTVGQAFINFMQEVTHDLSIINSISTRDVASPNNNTTILSRETTILR